MLRVILLTVLIAVLARALWRLTGGILAGAFQSPRGRAPQRGVRMVRDPVCGTFILPGQAVTVADHGHDVHFCSVTCRDAYRARTA